jgi:hypothetical protein
MKVEPLNLTFAVVNIVCGIIFILISLPLAARKIPMNPIYGFRITKAFDSDENWYAINHYGAKQLIFWSALLIVIGLLYLVFPISDPSEQRLTVIFAVAPIIICPAAAIWKTILYAKGL